MPLRDVHSFDFFVLTPLLRLDESGDAADLKEWLLCIYELPSIIRVHYYEGQIYILCVYIYVYINSYAKCNAM